MIEQALVFDQGGKTLLWHGPQGCTHVSIPDSRNLWEFIWEHRAEIGGVAHTHPWRGQPMPSNEDLTTFDAIDRALGRPLRWVILTEDNRRDYTREGEAWKVLPPVPLEGEQELRKRSGL